MSRNKQKGTAAESAVVAYLQQSGFPLVERRALNGAKDRGDISGIPFCVIEVKNQAEMRLSVWVDELEEEIKNDNAATGVVIHKRKGKGQVYNWYASMPVYVWLDLIKHWTGDEDELL